MSMFLSLTITAIVLGCMYGLIGLAYSLIYKASGLMNFAQGDFLSWGAFLGYTFYNLVGLPFAAAVLCTGIVMFVLGFLVQRGIIRTLINKGVSGVYLVLALFAFSYIAQNTSQIIWGTKSLRFNPVVEGTIKILGVAVQYETLICIVCSFAIMIVLHYFMTKTKLGTAMRAASMDPLAAESVGIDVALTSGLVWGLSSSICALGGCLCGPLYGVAVSLGGNLARKGFAGAVIGGYGNMYGAMIGGITMGFIETFVSSYVSSDLKTLIAYIILLLFLFIKPTGITNEKAIQDV